MHQVRDIREYKRNLRAFYKQKRFDMRPEEKQRRDEAIFRRITKLQAYRECETLLTYVSTPIEVDTRALIAHSLSQGKRVAVPRCVPGTRNMEFYYIRAFEDLEKGAFSVDEPVPQRCDKAAEFEKPLCILPGLCFDRKGYRLGYGKGYYDRFLARYDGATAGICYGNCIRYHLIHGRYDCRADVVITEKGILRSEIS